MTRPRLPSRLVQVLRALGLGVPLSREALALARAQLNASVRLAGPPGRIAIVGCGVMGQTIARSTRLLDGYAVTAIHDQRPEAVQSLQARLAPNAAIHASLAGLLDHRADWDVLAIATTADSHWPVARAALAAGARAIFLEKPVATSLADASALIDLAAQTGARLAVDHTRRWQPSSQGLRRLIDSGVIGRVCAINLSFGRAGFGMIGTHLFDLVRWLFDAEIVKVSAELDDAVQPDRRGARFIDPAGRCLAVLSDGVRLSVDLSDALALRQAYFVILGEHGRLEVDERLGRLRLVGHGGRVWETGYASLNAIELGVAAALHELHSGRPPRCSARDGRAALEAAIACQLSAREGGRWLALPLNGAACNERFPFA